MSTAEAPAGSTEFVDFWNEYPAKVLPRIVSFGDERKTALRGLLKRAKGSHELVERAAAAFASWDFAIEKHLNVDTFLRAKNRDKHLEWAENGPPSDNGSAATDAAFLEYADRRFKPNAGNLDPRG